ncbi:MAG: hypothetical protein HYV95_13140 [Opitutae bacterium]|nr:hypothetical protein [Opitutae bacterium]
MKSASPSLPLSSTEPAGSLVDAFGGRYYRISSVNVLPTFFMNVVSSSDLWLFLASNGALTAGRIDAEHALLPYQTVDKIYDSAGLTGPCTVLRVAVDGAETLWEPFAPHADHDRAITRNLFKSVEGDRVWFEEINHRLGLAFRYGWSSAESHGLIRRCELESLCDRPVSLHLLDGLRNLLPPGVSTRLQSTSSCLTDAYKTAELLPGTSLAVYTLAAGIVDRAIPMESLHAAAVWSEGLPDAAILLSYAQLETFCAGGRPATEPHRRGVRASYALAASLELAPRQTRRWLMVADTNLTQADVAARRQALAAGGLAEAALADADASTRRLRAIVASADGLQHSGDETIAAHHFANVLFNVMRGGVFADGYQIPGEDFAAFVRTHNRAASDRHAALLAALPASLPRDELLARIAQTGDADLARLGAEYLPITFSRRHGDPSRPWNRFSIRVRDAQGRRLLTHEGNWRDIFQNWESLCLSYPEFYEGIVAKFLNASTLDGYNPYRLTHNGIDWEVPDHEDPWATIGYWGDHQVIYLLKLLEWSARFHPGRLAASLRAASYSYARVPYRITHYAAMRQNPRATIEFDAALHRTIEQQVPQAGTDARLVPAPGGGVLHVNLTEKLLLLVLTRLTNFVPGGGIWMNTQRPEWNDANNALVGYGVSVVTLGYLRRLLQHCRTVLLPALDSAPVSVSGALVSLARQVQTALDAHRSILASREISSTARRALLDALAGAGSDYRAQVYRNGPGAPAALAPADIIRFFDTALDFVDHSLRANRRADGLYHAYNLLEFTDQPRGLQVHPLQPMLEGQVAVLSSGLLTPAETVDLLVALRRSPLYRADQHSYLLYPDRQLPGFLDRNQLPADAVASCPLLTALLAAGDSRLILHDASGQHRFHADLVNADALDQRLGQLAAEKRWADAVAAHAPQVRAIYESVFHHRAFTGRSGSMFGYEGLGCIYWHMVAKLLLAVQENVHAAQAAAAPEAARLAELYYDVRAGLGFNKTPASYGAIPTDPYSHTPGHSGAQQPGMTGQVKEEILTRLGELGVSVRDGVLAFAPALLRANEFTPASAAFRYVDLHGRNATLDLPAGALAFTFCGVPVVYRLSADAARLRLRAASGKITEVAGTALDAAASSAVFARTGAIATIEVFLGPAYRPL